MPPGPLRYRLRMLLIVLALGVDCRIYPSAPVGQCGPLTGVPGALQFEPRPEFPFGLAETVDPSADNITEAVETCLALAVGNSDPFKRVAAYLASLNDDRDWREAEVMEVQVRVIRALMKRIGPACD